MKVQENIDALERKFDELKRKAIKLLEESRTEVKNVVYELSTLPASEIGQHKVFLEEKSDKLEESKNHTALFRSLNLYWTYLSPDLLTHLVIKLPPLEEMKQDMQAYMGNLCKFRKETPLELFCETDQGHVDPPEGFANVVVRFKEVKSKKMTTDKLTLQDIEDFRQRYAGHYKLRDFAFMLRNEIQKGSFVVTFLVPESVTESLKVEGSIPHAIIDEFGVTHLNVDKVVVFCVKDEVKYTTKASNSPVKTGMVSGPKRSSSSDISPVLQSKMRENNHGSGYDCEFVTPPPNTFQTNCPICLHILKEPCVINCPCGQKICRECVQQIKKDNKPCPLCNLTDFTYMRDYGLERYLKEQEVWCSKKKDGCDWKGKLGEYEQHLNRNPSPENQLTGCQFVKVECEHGCGERFQRHHITSHQTNCSKRSYFCNYCQEYASTFEDVTENHYLHCSHYPVTCPNKCREEPFKQKDIEDHLKNICPLTEIGCCYVYAGCKVRLPRKLMSDHMEDTLTHMSLLETEITKLKLRNEELHGKHKATEKKYQKLEYKDRERRQEIQGLSETLDTYIVTEQQYQDLEQRQKETEKQCRELQGKLKASENQVKALKNELKRSLGEFPIDFPVKQEKICLPPFSYCGYRMCLNVLTKGRGSGKGTHVSIYTHLIKGHCDEHLKWPFRGEVTIQIVNQAGGHGHFEKTITYSHTTPDDSAGRLIDREKANGWGFDKFLAHTELEYNEEKNTQYLKDGILIVRIVRVKIAQ